MNNPTDKQTPVAGTSGVFLATVGALDHGQSLIDLDDALRRLTEAVQRVGTKGKLVYTLEVVPNGNGVGDVPLLAVVDDIKVTPPKTKRRAHTFFADEDHNLTRRHPGQGEMRLELVRVEKPTAPAATTPEAKAASNS